MNRIEDETKSVLKRKQSNQKEENSPRTPKGLQCSKKIQHQEVASAGPKRALIKH